MAQSQKPTHQGYAEIAKLLAGEASTKLAKICCYEGACSAAAEASTYASPAATKSVKSGFSMASADTVVTSTTTVTDDTCETDHVFTAGETGTMTGFGVFNNEATPDVLFAECCFNAGVSMESSDTLTVEMKLQLKLGA